MFQLCKWWYAWPCCLWQFEAFVYVNNICNFGEREPILRIKYTSVCCYVFVCFCCYFLVSNISRFFVSLNQNCWGYCWFVYGATIIGDCVVILGYTKIWTQPCVILSPLFFLCWTLFTMLSSMGGRTGASVEGAACQVMIWIWINLHWKVDYYFRNHWWVMYLHYESESGAVMRLLMLLVVHDQAIILWHWMIGMHHMF